MVNNLDLAPPTDSTVTPHLRKPSKFERLVINLHIAQAREAIEDDNASGTKVRPIFIDRLIESGFEWFVSQIEAERIEIDAAQRYALRYERSEGFFVIDRIPTE